MLLYKHGRCSLVWNITSTVWLLKILICYGPEVGGGGEGDYSSANTSQLTNGYLQSNLANNICHIWHRVSLNALQDFGSPKS